MDAAGDECGLWAAEVEKDRGEGGGRGRPELLRWKLGVRSGEGRSGSMRRFALREVRKAVLYWWLVCVSDNVMVVEYW